MSTDSSDKHHFTSKDIAFMGLVLGIALILSYIEALFPFFGGIPGMKAGLPNMAVVLLLYLYDVKASLLINLMRIIISGFLFGNMFGILFSIAGAIVSFIVMVLVKCLDVFDMRGVSVAGGVAHNVGQLLIAAFVVKTSGIIYYLPFLLISGTITCFVNGFIAEKMYYYLKNRI